MPFNSETAKVAGIKSRRGKSAVNATLRSFIFDLLNENQEKVRYMIGELPPKQFLEVYLKLIPYVLSQRSNQTIEVSELSEGEITEIIKEIVDEN